MYAFVPIFNLFAVIAKFGNNYNIFLVLHYHTRFNYVNFIISLCLSYCWSVIDMPLNELIAMNAIFFKVLTSITLESDILLISQMSI